MSEQKRLKDRYKAMPHGSARLQAIQQAVQKADEQKDREWQITHRYELADELHFYGDSAKTLPIIAQAAALFEQEPIESKVYDYLFSFYEALGVWDDLPHLPLEQREQMAQKFFDVLKQYGYQASLYHETQYNQLMAEGRQEEAEREYELRFAEQPGVRQTLSRCKACAQSMRVLHAIDHENREEAMELAKPLLDGTLSCSTEPWCALNQLFEFAWSQENRADVQFFGERLLQRLAWDPYAQESDVLCCYILSHIKEGLKALERTLPEILQKWSQRERQDYFQSAWLLLTRAAQTDETLSLSLPKEFALYREDGRYNAAELAQWFYEQALDIAKKFDQRNGYPYYQNQMEKAGQGLQAMMAQEISNQ